MKTFEKFLALIGPELSAKIEFVCSAMWKPYLRVIREQCGQALHVVERCHIVKKLQEAVEGVRLAEARRMVRDGDEPLLKKSRWCLLKRPENLTTNQKVKLRTCCATTCKACGLTF